VWVLDASLIFSGSAVSWSVEQAHPRVALLPKSYLEVEEEAAKIFHDFTSVE
jgi:hypothetical protein